MLIQYLVVGTRQRPTEVVPILCAGALFPREDTKSAVGRPVLLYFGT